MMERLRVEAGTLGEGMELELELMGIRHSVCVPHPCRVPLRPFVHFCPLWQFDFHTQSTCLLREGRGERERTRRR